MKQRIPRPRHIVSGGQTGVDRAALDAALALGIPCGGWCPRGRLAEDGPIPDRYPLLETESADYAERTERNVADSDATLVLTRGAGTGGTAFTVECATRLAKPHHVVDLARGDDPMPWLAIHGTGVLNVAGPRESGAPGVYGEALEVLLKLWE